jgi:hypothetical protein
MNLERTVTVIRDRVHEHLSGRSGTWLASFAELVAMAEECGVPTAGLQPVLASHLGSDADGDVLDQEDREALIDALVGRWAAARYRGRGSDGPPRHEQ